MGLKAVIALLEGGDSSGVPYTGATQSVDLGLWNLSAANVILTQPTAATSGSKAVSSNLLTLDANAWNNVAASQAVNATLQWTPQPGDSSSPGLLDFELPSATGAFNNTIEVRFRGINTYLNMINTNDQVSGFFGESYQAAQFGMKNNYITTQGVIPPNQAWSFLYLNQYGAVYTTQGEFGQYNQARNTLDDGTSGANATFKGSVTVSGTMNAVGFSANGTAGISATITTAALTTLGTQGSMTFTNGLLTSQTPAT